MPHDGPFQKFRSWPVLDSVWLNNIGSARHTALVSGVPISQGQLIFRVAKLTVTGHVVSLHNRRIVND
jgi:hypothetical protein